MKTEQIKSAYCNKSPITCLLKLLFILLIFSLSIGATHGYAKNISGYVRNSIGNGIGGVTLFLSNNVGSTTTDSSGYYSKGIPNGWSGTIIPSKDGYSFSPTSRSYTNFISNATNQNFTGIQNQQYTTISGYVRTSSGSGISKVTVTFGNGGGTDTTNSSGYYSHKVAYDWNGRVTPSKGGYSFTPASRIYSNVTVDQSNQNYTGNIENELLSITINIAGSGIVEVDPDQDFYPEGSFITLTAAADSGWVFSKWSGQIDSSDNPKSISINSNMTIAAVFLKDFDNDGVSDKEENSGPGNGDGNNDGILDSLQSNVAYLAIDNTADYTALETPPGTSIKNCKAIIEPPDNNYPSDVEFLYGFFSFAVEGIGIGGSTSVTLYFSSDVTFNMYSKYGPTPDDPFYHWYEFIFDGQTGAEINKNVITLHFVDGTRGDDDLTVDGNVIDLGGPGVKANMLPGSSSTLNVGGDDGYGCFIGCLY